MESRSWEETEVDCLVHIFTQVGLEDLCLTLPLVCKRWLAAVKEPLCWKKLDFRMIDLLPWSDFSKKFSMQYSLPYFSFSCLLRLALKRSCGSVSELRLPLKHVSIADLLLASQKCPRLRSLALPVLSRSEEEQLPLLISQWKNLQHLQMELKPENFAELVKSISLHCRKFSGFKFSGTITKADASAIVCHLPNIKYLDLSGSYLLREELLLILNGSRKLEKLTLDECIGFDGEDREVLEKASAVKFFSNRGCKLYYEHVDDDFCDFYSYGYIL